MENMSTSDEYKLGVYYPVLGSFLMELETCNKMLELWRPFKQTQSSVKQALEFCFSQTTDKKNYNLDHAVVSMEAMLAKRTMAKSHQKQSVMFSSQYTDEAATISSDYQCHVSLVWALFLAFEKEWIISQINS